MAKRAGRAAKQARRWRAHDRLERDKAALERMREQYKPLLAGVPDWIERRLPRLEQEMQALEKRIREQANG